EWAVDKNGRPRIKGTSSSSAILSYLVFDQDTKSFHCSVSTILALLLYIVLQVDRVLVTDIHKKDKNEAKTKQNQARDWKEREKPKPKEYAS
ncbi:hypothetical protein Tco_1450630, partial [Tanacetum coccineum]